MTLQELRKIGLTDGEIKVYEALFELGECTKTALAKKSGISPSNIYDVTNRLIEKGIISKVEKNGISHFSPASPKHLLGFLEQKEDEIKKEKNFVNSILPSLLLKFSETREKVNVEVFLGWNGMKTIFEDLVDECKKGDKNFIFGASKGESDKQADRFFLKYSKLRSAKGIITNIIFNKELKQRKERIDFFMKSKNYNIRFLQQSTPAEIMVYKNKACIIILIKDPLIIRITGSEVADSFKQYFDIMWASAVS
ncbi:MAG: helix-turn-helix domain-containing protein [Nanoarchaeota archaeon]|nr:helix-turn-helix domain-containing protein [Nanoarchaeota archaeon]